MAVDRKAVEQRGEWRAVRCPHDDVGGRDRSIERADRILQRGKAECATDGVDVVPWASIASSATAARRLCFEVAAGGEFEDLELGTGDDDLDEVLECRSDVPGTAL